MATGSMTSMFSLEGKNAMIVGASRGIGAEIARAFAGLGAGVALCARSEGALCALSEELESAGHRSAPIVADVRDPDAAAAVVKEANERVGSVDILVYSAGQHVVGKFEEIPEEDWRRLFEVNVLGAVSFAKAVMPGQRRRGWGRIINIASTAGKNGSMFQSPYNATKHALLGLTRCLALESAAAGITVNAVCPGYVNTEMTTAALPSIASLVGVEGQELVAKLLEKVPIGRMIEPCEVAQLACYLASPAAAGLTGQGVTLAGGLILF